MKRIIINADDLGYSTSVNEAVFKLLEAGRVTSSTLIVNGPAAEAAARELHNWPSASFGVHLNVTEFTPLSCGDNSESPWNRDGRDVFSIPRTREVRKAIAAEWSAQVQRAIDMGVPVSHLDAHHHVHTIPALFPALKDVQRKFGIRKVRLTRNIFDLGEQTRPGLRQGKALWNYCLRHYYRTRTTDRFCGFSIFHSRLMAGEPWEGTVELMCHPGNAAFALETSRVDSPWCSALAPDAKFISYNDL